MTDRASSGQRLRSGAVRERRRCIVQIIDTDQLAIDKLEAERHEQTALVGDAPENLRGSHRGSCREIDPLLIGLMNKVYIELLQETQPGGA